MLAPDHEYNFTMYETITSSECNKYLSLCVICQNNQLNKVSWKKFRSKFQYSQQQKQINIFGLWNLNDSQTSLLLIKGLKFYLNIRLDPNIPIHKPPDDL